MSLFDKKNPLTTLITGWALLLLVGMVGVIIVIIFCSRPYSVEYNFTLKPLTTDLAPFKAIVFNCDCDDPDASFRFSSESADKVQLGEDQLIIIAGRATDFTISAPRDMLENMLTADVVNDTLYVTYNLKGPKHGHRSYNHISQLDPVVITIPDSSLTSVSDLSSRLPDIWLKNYHGDEIDIRISDTYLVDCRLEKMTLKPVDINCELAGVNSAVMRIELPLEYQSEDVRLWSRQNFTIKEMDIYPVCDSITDLDLSLYRIINDSLRIDPAIKYRLNLINSRKPRNSSNE